MNLETNNKKENSNKFEKLLEKRRQLSKENKSTIIKVSASDSQLSDTIKN